MSLTKTNDLKVTNKSIIKEIKKIGLPIAFQMVLMSALQLVDNFFVGFLDSATQAASGVNAVSNLSFIINSIVVGFLMALGVHYTKMSATKSIEKQHELFKIKILWSLILTAVFLATMMPFIKPLLSLWASSEASTNFGMNYGMIIIPSLVLEFMSISFANSYKESKNSKVPMLLSLAGLFLNSLLNYLLMYVFHMGLMGAAYATLAARIFNLLIWIIYIEIKKPNFIPKLITIFNLNYKNMFFYIRKSTFWAINSFILGFAFTLQIMFVSRISDEAGSSLISAGAVLQLVNAFVNGFSQATSIMIVSFIAIGTISQNKEYIKKVSWISIIFGLISALLMCAISPITLVIYPKYGSYVNTQSIIMIITVGLTTPIALFVMALTSALKAYGYSKTLLVFDGMFSYLVPLPICLVLTLTNNDIDYGWVYAIVFASVIIKPIPLMIFYKKAINKI